MINPREPFPLFPLFCPVHGSNGPCFDCLVEEVAEIITNSPEGSRGVLFVDPDFKCN